MKKKILWLGEATYLNTGYGVYGREVLSRLHATGKYQIAELGCYGEVTNPKRLNIPWTYYGNLPQTKGEDAEYRRSKTNEWGLWRLEQTLIDFQPDIVLDVRDWWMLEFVDHSPFRDKFFWGIMPTIDSIPQRPGWLDTYMRADAVCAYSEFGRDYMVDATNKRVRFVDLASPAADYGIFKPVPDKQAHRLSMGLDPSIFIVGTIMRNQKRKLYPDLIKSFAQFLQRHPKEGYNAFLYCHTSFPDIGWDIPMLVREAGIGHKVLFTYICKNCRHLFPSFFHDSVQTCPRCKRPTAKLPSANFGATTQQLSDILNTFDLYVQYSMCEGFGMPQIEAAACGVPVAAVDYSAMSSVIHNLKSGGISIPPRTLFLECETHSYRAYPDNDAFIQRLNNFINKSEDIRRKMSKDAYMESRQIYTWDKAARVWETICDNAPSLPEDRWKSPPRVRDIAQEVPNGLDNEQFVRWCIEHIWGEPDRLNDYLCLRMIRDLNYGYAMTGNGGLSYGDDSIIGETKYRPFGRSNVVGECRRLAEARNYWEQRRAGIIQEDTPNFIKKAKREEE